jgi:type VI secretion system protein ImpH
MPASYRHSATSLVDRLENNPHRFDFFQAVRMLERVLQKVHQAARDSRGNLNPSDSRMLAFKNTSSLSFPASQIEKLVVQKNDEGHLISAELTPAFISFLGQGGVMPMFYTELLASHEFLHGDAAAREFLDIFLQRIASLFYRSWRKNKLLLRYETDQRDKSMPLLLSVAGIGQSALRHRLKAPMGGVSDDTIAFFSGFLQQRHTSASVLKNVLQHYFGVPVVVQEFVGRWFTVPSENQTKIGMMNAQLGTSALVGEKIWQRDLRVRLSFGPMHLNQYQLFLPGGKAALALKELLLLVSGVSLEYEVVLILRKEDVQPIALASQSTARLGWETFLVSKRQDHDRSDASYVILAA